VYNCRYGRPLGLCPTHTATQDTHPTYASTQALEEHKREVKEAEEDGVKRGKLARLNIVTECRKEGGVYLCVCMCVCVFMCMHVCVLYV